MKVLFCGPPHSGKTVLISNLVRLMPSDAYCRIDANGDGESTWSNNPNQEDVLSVRVKSGNNSDDFERWKKQIHESTMDIVLVDIGGKLQGDKTELFQACDYFVVVSNDNALSEKWMEFGEGNGCKCLAIIYSNLDGKDEVMERIPYLKAKISNLKRGLTLTESITLRELADVIVCESGYRPEIQIDFVTAAKQIGVLTEWTSSKGVVVPTANIEESHAPLLYSYFKSIYRPSYKYKISGFNIMWAACLAVTCLGKNESDNLNFYDSILNKYIKPTRIAVRKNASNDFNLTIKESDNEVLLRSYLGKFPQESILNKFLPAITPTKDLYISGRFQPWLFASIQLTYSNPRKFIHRPGIGYICVDSPNPSDIGTVSTKFTSVDLRKFGE